MTEVETDRHSDKTFTIVIYGNDFAAHIFAAGLTRNFSSKYRVVHVAPDLEHDFDALYGSSTGPNGYKLFRSIGIEEPDLFQQSDTTFSYGTHFRDWPSPTRHWVQCYSQPFQIIGDCLLDQVVSFHGRSLQEHLIAAQAALAGRFAHPPDDPNNPLSRAEYGFHFAPDELIRLARDRIPKEKYERLTSTLKEVRCTKDGIDELVLDDGRLVSGDLFVDGSGPSRRLMRALNVTFNVDQTLAAEVSQKQVAEGQPPCRVVSALENGWQLSVPLNGRLDTLVIKDTDTAPNGLHFETGSLKNAWHGNCLAIGTAASVLEPLTPAPFTMLHNELLRILELMPTTSDMTVERREFNRRFRNDVEGTSDFHRALFLDIAPPETTYWVTAAARPISERLQRKLTQFKSRGVVVQFDFEPFHREDWSILHYGMGRQPRRTDPRLHVLKDAERVLGNVQEAISSLVSRMPPHQEYVQRFVAYLEKKQYGHN